MHQNSEAILSARLCWELYVVSVWRETYSGGSWAEGQTLASQSKPHCFLMHIIVVYEAPIHHLVIPVFLRVSAFHVLTQQIASEVC